MIQTLVTGATGFVGWHVARQLIERGDRVRILVRDPARVRELDGAETAPGDLRDRDSLERAVAGCGVVYHVAADYRLWARDPSELYRTNVQGTRNLLDACRKAGVERVVYTSTVGCIGVPRDGEGDEDRPVGIEDMTGAYKRSKFQAERAALEFAAAGLPVVIVNPTAPVGDRDFKPTPTGKLIVDYLRGAMPAYVETGLNLVDVADVAAGHLLACERGGDGERYILGCRNLTLKEIFERLETISGVRAPRTQIPYAAAYAAGVVSTGWAWLTGKEPLAPLDGVRMSRKKMFVSHGKAARVLGFSPGPVEGALQRAVEWFRKYNYC
ncbi:MAG: NAD-dependent epimerase/dehydratase family protein [Bryobacteraceae bacterium]|nr:NAD-dependent epimerase/dehydratase family protein [Bryobacteraceae bacterium]